MLRSKKFFNQVLVLLASFALVLGLAGYSFADLYINILAVNGTNSPKEKDIRQVLPQELAYEDILDAAGLQVKYDVKDGAYIVSGKVKLEAKETKTYKVRIRDLWQINREDVDEIKQQIDSSLERLKETDFYDNGVKKKDYLNKRLDLIVEEQEKFSDNIEKRIDRYRAYAPELAKIRSEVVSVEYWRSRPPDPDEIGVISYIIEAENPSETQPYNMSKKRYYLPPEVKPEHFIELQGFDIGFDGELGQIYLSKDEELKPSEKKKYAITLVNVWKIKQKDIDDLKDRAKNAYTLLQRSIYVDTADYLMRNIKSNLESIEVSQALEKNVDETISDFRVNTKRFEGAKKDVESLEDLVRIIREELERSKVKNVLKRMKALKSVADIAESIFKRPQENTAWKIIAGIVIFVALVTIIHFTLWGRRSKALKDQMAKKVQEDQKEKI